MSIPNRHPDSEVIKDADEVFDALQKLRVPKGGTLTLPLEINEKPFITVKGLVPGDPKARKTMVDENAPMVEEKAIAGYSRYIGKDAGGPFEVIVAHYDRSHVMSIIKLLRDGDVDQLFISKRFVHDMLSIKEDEDPQVCCRGHLRTSDTVWF